MKAGFTLIELLLYVTVVTLMLSAMIPLAWSVIGQGAKNSVYQEVTSNGRYVAERIKYEIRRASGITSVNSNSISLTNFSPDTSTVIDLVSGKVRINKNGAGFVNLNSDDTAASNLVFINNSSASTENIQFKFNIASSLPQSRQEYVVSSIWEGSVEVRSN